MKYKCLFSVIASILLLTSCFPSAKTTCIDIFDELPSMDIDSHETLINTNLYVPKTIETVQDIPVCMTFALNGYAIDVSGIRSNKNYTSYIEDVPVCGNIPTISNFVVEQNGFTYYDGMQIYSFNGMPFYGSYIERMTTIHDSCLYSSAIFKRDNNYYLFDISDDDARLTIVNSDFQIIYERKLNVSGQSIEDGIYISYGNSTVKTSNNEFTELLINNHLFSFDISTFSLTTEGYVPLKAFDFESPVPVMKKSSNSYLYYQSFQYNENPLLTKSLPFKDYTDVTLSIFSDSDILHAYMNIGYENSGEFRYFTEYLNIHSDSISHYCFSDYSFYLGTTIFASSYFRSEIYASTTDDYNKKKAHMYYLSEVKGD